MAATPLVVRSGTESVTLVLHTVDGLRQTPRSAGLTSDPRLFNGTVEVPQTVLDHLDSYPPTVRTLIQGRLHGARFTPTDVRVTDRAMTVDGLGVNLSGN